MSKSSQRLQAKLRFWLEITRIQTAQPWIAMDQKQTVQWFSIELTPGASELTSVADIWKKPWELERRVMESWAQLQPQSNLYNLFFLVKRSPTTSRLSSVPLSQESWMDPPSKTNEQQFGGCHQNKQHRTQKKARLPVCISIRGP